MICSVQTHLTDRQTEYPAVDIIKFLCAFLVVAIHVAPLPSATDNTYAKLVNYGIQNYLARIAVPFFFAAAGFFLFRKIDFDKYDGSIISGYALKNLRLLGIWCLLLFVGDTYHLWYIKGLVVAVCVLGVLLYYQVPIKKMVILAAVLYAIGLIGDSYYGILNYIKGFPPANRFFETYELVFRHTRNGIFMGFPFLLLGGAIEKKRPNIRPQFAALGFIISMIALLGEVYIIRMLNLPKRNNMYIFLAPSIYFLLTFAINVEIKGNEIYKKLRIVGVIVYFSHLFVYKLILWGFSAINIDISNTGLDYLLTVLLSTCLGFALEKLSHKEKLSFIKYLYS